MYVVTRYAYLSFKSIFRYPVEIKYNGTKLNTPPYTMIRYVIYSDNYGYFKPGHGGSKSLWYNDSDFVQNSEDAYWYKTEKGALDTAIKVANKLDNIIVVSIDVTIVQLPHTSNANNVVNDMREQQLATATKIYTDMRVRMDDMSEAEVEQISTKQWNAYIEAKCFLQNIN